MLISLAVVPVSKDVWISSVTDEDIMAFGKPKTTGVGSHLIGLKSAELSEQGLLTFERHDALLIRRGRATEAVLFRDILPGGTIIRRVDMIIGPADDVYWVTVGTGRQGNFEIGMQNGVWGVPPEYGDRIKDLKPGAKLVFYGKEVGFALCSVRGKPYHDATPLWPDGPYPYRIRIDPPIRRNEANDFRAVYPNLRDREGKPYKNAQAAGMAIGGVSGIFRPLRRSEVIGIMNVLGWE